MVWTVAPVLFLTSLYVVPEIVPLLYLITLPVVDSESFNC